MNRDDDLKNRTLTLERTFNAPLDLVWEAWTQPEHIIKWWGPKGMKTTVLEHNFSAGGKWKYVMEMPDGNEFIADGEYLEIVKHQKIVSTANFKPMTENVEIHALFKADGNTTKFTFHCVHETEEYCRQQEQMGFYNGWGSVFDRLQHFLQKTKS
ncbi:MULTISPECIES: SRPBCC domain-containing protein [Flavobacteriaceae]|uniref:SRPBCC family protein n=1 Tax=Flavobacteriaceae TaxID=49546 RepID=UPI001491D5AE|nr:MULTISPECIES: SRPBCC domain-containing protein [Allomuricauda]MDC6365052.1 SRPBCC domain-containing protein [Muricauda sp. AC10]